MDKNVLWADPDVKVKEEELEEEAYHGITTDHDVEYEIDIQKREEEDVVNDNNAGLLIELPCQEEEVGSSKYVTDDLTEEHSDQEDQKRSDVHKKFECKLCGKKYSQSSSLYRHMVQHNNNKSYECGECGKQFFRRYNLHRHISGKRNCKKECPVCLKVFPTHELLIAHVLDHKTKDVENVTDGVAEQDVDATAASDCVAEQDINATVASDTTAETTHTDNTDVNSSKDSLSKYWREVEMHQEVTPEKPLQCKLCDKTCISKTNLKRHMYTHTGLKPHKCQECGRAFARRNQLTRHEERHQVREYKECHLCHRSVLNIENHLLYHERETPSKCDSCHKEFSYRHELIAHQLSSACTTTNNIKFNREEEGSSRPFECEECGKRYKEKKALTRHKKTHAETRPYTCGRCGKGFFRQYYLLRHVSSSSCKKGKPCKVCDVMFQERDMLFNHVREHFDTQVEICNRCGEPFTSVKMLRKHKRSHHRSSSLRHSPEYYFKCSNSWVFEEDLPSNLPENSVISRYLKTMEKMEAGSDPAEVHTKVQTRSSNGDDLASTTRINIIRCVECHQTFTNVRSLDRHEKSNCGRNKPYKCSLCKKSFARRYGLMRHMKSHNSARPQEKCQQCGKLVFDLQLHMSRHDSEQYTCEVCNAGFSFKLDLLAHEKVHSGVKQEKYECEECGATFAQGGSLTRHMRQHEDGSVGKFKCNICEKTFHRKWNLLRHLEQRSCASIGGGSRNASSHISLDEDEDC